MSLSISFGFVCLYFIIFSLVGRLYFYYTGSDTFEDTDRFKILLCHIPTVWLDWSKIDEYPVDLVLSGHYHGGQIRLPLIGGLYAPYVGLFPEYTKGVFEGEMATCVLSAGLGSLEEIPRLNNPPQVVCIELVPGAD